MFVRAREELVCFICSRTRSPRLWDANRGNSCYYYLIAFVDLVPVATDRVSLIQSNIIWNGWESTPRARSIRANLNQGTEM